MYRSPSPYKTPETHYQPYPAAGNTQPAQTQQAPGQILPGTITYTTSTGPDGQVTYHPFKAVAASYQTPSGIVSGIQWVPAEATQILPSGAQPATSNFTEAWRGRQLTDEDQKSLKEWQRVEEKRRRKEEKDSAKVLRERSRSRGDPDSELRYARERDAVERERRKSINQGTSPLVGATMPAYATSYSGYPGSNQPTIPSYGSGPPVANGPTYTHDRRYSSSVGGMADFNQQFADMGLDRDRDFVVERERKVSTGGGLSRPLKYSVPESTTERARKPSGGFSNPYPPAPGARAQPVPSYPPGPGEGGFVPPYSNAPAPGVGRSASPMPYANMSVYPPGHVLEGKPVPHSRSTTPLPAGPPVPFPTAPVQFPQPTIGSSPKIGQPVVQSQQFNVPGQQQLAAPPCFSRPVNAAQSYVTFSTMKIQDMDDFLDKAPPRMPAVLKPHDVYVEDWNRMMQDISLAWSGRLPVPNLTDVKRPPKRGILVADLIDLWNTSFFIRRGVEVVLYKGQERRSGPNSGVVDLPAHLFQDNQHSSSSESDSEFDEDADNTYGYYPTPQGSMAEVLELRRRRNEVRVRKRENRMRKREKAKERKYTLYLTCVPPPGAGHSGQMYPYNR